MAIAQNWLYMRLIDNSNFGFSIWTHAICKMKGPARRSAGSIPARH
ncbi:hypothetical protein BRUCa_2839 [Brucella melitensis]|uniref:Uncharacterized protein n=1 Tax=Brucella ovis (strain ATCC 25840 / 63/290 / NCTC 10512) TaxID=444178 RepID=A0A0H3ATU6_BRUO2|nr:hypothetical protein BOV_A0657 [Brucella ovis ATCC 25840]ADZ67917.1 conserved hypothetical protein [Brucella melitensis M28]ADZ88784.1 conserved hypothetical protein [Brucella melitensis M5-90]AEW15308.1 hypothetical protein BCA52141_II0234 [Brucella canis HSK A52141]AEW19231.1 hypothetical protein BAA13334_II01082 [Brucella abortus A13334]AIB19343.1 Hypothetical protein BSSP3_II0654 [Brucella suis bv. 2]EFG36173.1 hypothetical protein BAZG_02486 [Brucella sp. NVSL 07-0026]